MGSSTITSTTVQPAKFSRYRSVRRANTPKTLDDAPPVPHVADLNRAPSRYRRPSRPTIQSSPPLPSLEKVPTIPSPIQRLHSPESPGRKAPGLHANSPITPPANVTVQKQVQKIQDGNVSGDSIPYQQTSRKSTERCERLNGLNSGANCRNTDTPGSYEAAREEARMILEGEYDRLQKVKQEQEQKHSEPKLSTPQKLRPRASTVNERKLPTSQSATTRYDSSKFIDAPKQAQTRRVPAIPAVAPAWQHIIRDQAPKPRPVAAQPELTRENSHPAFDAPLSAVNAGDRRVEIRSNSTMSSITLPVTPSTTVRELLNSASICMSESFDPRTAILVESFSSAGLERPLRRYEHVRDVMNSWDTDVQNHLIIMSSSDCTATGLDQKEAPLSQPTDTKLEMTVSCRPGKWEKKWLVLRSDGQITASKHDNDGEVRNICHLSDFDVYTPTRKQLKKTKSPKKNCFAIKSLQKSAMFLEGTNFIHFFATNDKQAADRWYRAVQSWRSWYLVYVMGEGMQPRRDQEAHDLGSIEARRVNPQSQEAIPYQLGSFKPLLEFDDLHLGRPLEYGDSSGYQTKLVDDNVKGCRSMEHRKSTDVGDGQPRHSQRQTRVPPSSFPTKLLTDVRNKVDLGLDTDDQAFTGAGLLARSASRRAQGGTGTGHGVPGMRGRPLVDLTGSSEFADGSLLRQLEAWTVSHGDQDSKHKIDRQRRVEAEIRVGEGM